MTAASKELPRREKTKRMQRAMVTLILCSARLNVTQQLGSFLDAFMKSKNENGAFIVASMLADPCFIDD